MLRLSSFAAVATLRLPVCCGQECLHDVGVDCTSTETNSITSNPSSCCMAWNHSVSEDLDRHAPCQLNDCTDFQPCAVGYGADCSRSGRFACCISDGKISEHDPCQQNFYACNGRYKPCSGVLGRDCSGDTGVCCLGKGLPKGTCHPNCAEYIRELAQREEAIWQVSLVYFAGLAVVCACLWPFRNQLSTVWEFFCRQRLNP